MKLLLLLTLLLTSIFSYSQIVESFDSFDGPGEWSSPGLSNTGSHGGDLCFNITGDYLPGQFYVFQSPILDLLSYSQVDVMWYQLSDIRPGDVFGLYFYDNGWFWYDISNLNGLYSISVPNTTRAFAFVLNTNMGSGDLAGKYSHVSSIQISDAIALPVELLDFTATLVPDGVDVNWSTASENNSSYFSVLRSEDGTNWEKLIDINAAINSTQVIDYYYKDRSILYNYSYYKLRQVDLDGTEEEFSPVSIYRKTTPRSNKLYNLMGQEVNDSYKGFVIDSEKKLFINY